MLIDFFDIANADYYCRCIFLDLEGDIDLKKLILLSLSMLFEQNKGKERNMSRKILLNKCQGALSSKYGVEARGGVLPSYSGLYGEAPPKRGVFFKLTVSWHTKLAPAVLAAVKTEFSYVIIPRRDIGYIAIWIT